MGGAFDFLCYHMTEYFTNIMILLNDYYFDLVDLTVDDVAAICAWFFPRGVRVVDYTTFIATAW